MSQRFVPDRWERYFEILFPVEFLILEQVYLVEKGPVSTDPLRRRLAHLEATATSIDRHVNWLEGQNLVRTVRSCGRLVSPVHSAHRNVTILVQLWRFREERRLRMESPTGAAGGRSVAG